MSNVMHFGAKGDGTTDDSDAIQHALTNGDGVLELPRGDYLITRTIQIPLVQARRTAITGFGGTAKVIMAGEGPAFHILGNHTGTAHPPDFKPDIWASQRMPTVQHIEIEGRGDGLADGFRVEGVMQPTFEGVLLRELRHGIHVVKRNRNLLITHCHIYHCSGIGIYLDGVNLHQTNIASSHISYCRLGGIRIERSEIRNLQITGNDIEYNNAATFKGMPAEPTAEIFIDASAPGASVREGTIASNTIQATYSAGGANVRIIGGEGTDDSGALNRKAGMWTLTGNLIGSQEINVHLKNARGVVVTGNFIYSGHQRNILVEGSKNIVMSGNCFEHNPDYKEKELCTGVRIEGSENVSFTGSILHDCQAGKHTVPTEAKFEREGLLEVVKCNRVTISGNQILDGVPHGVFIDGCEQVSLTGNTIVDTRAEKLGKEAVMLKTKPKVMVMEGNIVDPQA
ncbi:MAG: right-handed parallel beta-helix repeat-containing protein [Phycisphaeraceae bacterium]